MLGKLDNPLRPVGTRFQETIELAAERIIRHYEIIGHVMRHGPDEPLSELIVLVGTERQPKEPPQRKPTPSERK